MKTKIKIALLSPAGAMHRYNGHFHKSLHYAPLTLTLLAALVPPEIKAEIKIYDETAEAIPLDLAADLIGMTCITGTAPRCYKYADYFRARGIKVILGGPHPSLLPKEAARHADSVIIGLGDETWPQAVRDFCRGRLKKFYMQTSCSDIADRPLPRRDLLKKRAYITLNTIEAVRGCNNNCSFCAYPAAFGRPIYKRPVAEVIAEIKTLKGKIVIFPDVNLISDVPYARELFTALIPLKKWWFGLTTSAIGHLSGLLQIFAQSGCKGLLLGLESVNQTSQVETGKNVNQVGSYARLIDQLHQRGILVMGCFAFGADGDGRDVFARTVALTLQAKIDLPRYSLLTPFPGTRLFGQLKKARRITKHDWALYDVEHVVFKPKQMSASALEQGITWAWRETYSYRRIWQRIDFKNFGFNPIPYLIFLITNLGYRRYALSFSLHDDQNIIDNSDIPEC